MRHPGDGPGQRPQGEADDQGADDMGGAFRRVYFIVLFGIVARFINRNNVSVKNKADFFRLQAQPLFVVFFSGFDHNITALIGHPEAGVIGKCQGFGEALQHW